MNKDDIRLSIKQLKNEYSKEYKISAPTLASAKLESTDIFKRSNNILLYYSLPDEISTIEFLKKWCTSKSLYLPRVNGDKLDIIKYSKSDLTIGAYNIYEPQGECVPLDIIDLIIVPGVAFDRQGNRLGRGKGFYDKLLYNCKVPKIGFAYSDQLISQVPCDSHDIPMDMVITDKEILVTDNKDNK